METYHSADAAKRTLDEWNTRFSKRDLEHADLPAFSPAEREDLTAVNVVSDVYRKVFQLEKSHSEVSRLIKQGSVEIDGTKIHDPKAKVALHPGQILRLDRKRAVRIALDPGDPKLPNQERFVQYRCRFVRREPPGARA